VAHVIDAASVNEDPAQLQARILFLCHHDVEDPTRPTFTGEAQGVHFFNWTTRHACSTIPTIPAYAINEENTPVPEDDSEKEEADDGQELLDPLPISNSQRRSTTTIFLLTVYAPSFVVQVSSRLTLGIHLDSGS
jgi:hypothetical protein